MVSDAHFKVPFQCTMHMCPPLPSTPCPGALSTCALVPRVPCSNPRVCVRVCPCYLCLCTPPWLHTRIPQRPVTPLHFELTLPRSYVHLFALAPCHSTLIALSKFSKCALPFPFAPHSPCPCAPFEQFSYKYSLFQISQSPVWFPMCLNSFFTQRQKCTVQLWHSLPLPRTPVPPLPKRMRMYHASLVTCGTLRSTFPKVMVASVGQLILLRKGKKNTNTGNPSHQMKTVQKGCF